jgi:protein-tyrosine-phosphatase
VNILFVCSGNISRSFLAERLLMHEAQRLGAHDVRVASAGLFAYPGNPPDEKIVAYLSELGIAARGHGARQLAGQDVEAADLILVMERLHARMIEAQWPRTRPKVRHLGTFIAGSRDPDDIVDPYGRTAYHYRLAQSQITLAVRSLMETLASGEVRKRDAQD